MSLCGFGSLDRVVGCIRKPTLITFAARLKNLLPSPIAKIVNQLSEGFEFIFLPMRKTLVCIPKIFERDVRVSIVTTLHISTFGDSKNLVIAFA
ncbi:Uncharacterised protein [Comamonas testosteroni]|uniref:Uncharacterized protein n=1 Tax=Comamonas testosteroni TaxID=285 RepID=A0A8B4S9Y9_COMTE|nr:Uncharacterised protein [Comamonas testosteroni]